MSAQQYRNEKKFIDEAVAKVREVVHTASKNDIILALHNFDFDVTKTIQAFCDDGAQSALDSWERTGPGGNKKKNQKKKKAKDHASGATATASATPSTTSARPSAPQAMNGVIVPPMANGVTKVTPKPNNRSEIGSLPTPVAGQGGPVSDDDSTPKVPSVSSISFKGSTTTTLDDVQSFDTAGIGEDRKLIPDAAGLKDHSREIEKVESIFENEISVAEENVRNSFKCIRQILGERESHLLAELRRTHDEGARFFNERRVQSCELDERANRMSAMSDREQAELRDEIARFIAEKEAEEEIARATRFHCDNAQLIKLVKNFGEVVAVKGIGRGATASVTAIPRQAPATVSTYTIKHSTSHSSIVSSLGEDSGLGQISPIGNEDRKNVAEVSNGGILMKSDALTAEQLADLNKKLQESLKAQGIDASILSGIGNRNAMPARRRPPGGGGRGGGGGQSYSGRGGGRGGGAGGNKRTLVRVPNLSIFQP